MIVAESALIIECLLEHFGKNETSRLLPKQWKEGQEGKLCGETEEWMRYKYFLHYAEGSLMTLMLVGLITESMTLFLFCTCLYSPCANRRWLLGIRNSPVPFFIKPITSRIAAQIHAGYLDPNLELHFNYLEAQLRTAPGGGGYLCGALLTGADILMSFPLIASKGRSPILTEQKFPLLWKYIVKLEQEPGYKKAMEKIVEMDGSFSATF